MKLLASITLILTIIVILAFTQMSSNKKVKMQDHVLDSSQALNETITHQLSIDNAQALKHIQSLLSKTAYKVDEMSKGNRDFHDNINDLQRRLNKVEDSNSNDAEEIVSTDSSLVDNPTMTMENLFLNEKVDSDWSASAEWQFLDSLDQLSNDISDLKISDVLCSSSICRLEYQLGSKTDIQSSIEFIGHNLSWESKSYSEYTTNELGEVTIKSFYLREGFDFPEGVSNAIN